MIILDDVTYIYDCPASGGTKDGVRGINLQVQDGECVVLCGKSGCGKTTVTRLINGLIPHFYQGHYQGSVTVGGMDMRTTPLYEAAAKVGSVFQNPRSQFFNVDTDGEIAFAMENLGCPVEQMRRRVQETAIDLQVEDLLGRSVFSLSGGEKQKIAFASICAVSPDIYVLDEPSSNLDIYAIEELRKIITRLKCAGKTIIIAEHRLYYLRNVADHLIYMEQGTIVEQYTPTEFQRLDQSFRESRGLRALDLSSLTYAVGDQPQNLRQSGNSANSENSIDSQSTNSTNILSVIDVGIQYGATTVVDHINLNVESGEIIGVIGHNGAGKSTFARTLCGLHKLYAGKFLWNGEPASDKQRLQMSYMVMQDVNYQLFAESVEQECSLGIVQPEPQRVTEVLQNLHLHTYRDKHPLALSGGQKQRVAVAVSMLSGKQVIIFDEPTSGLDYESMMQVCKLIEELSRQGKIIFIVTHDYELIVNVCRRIIRFDRGSLIEDYKWDGRFAESLNEQPIDRVLNFFKKAGDSDEE